jgi:hypothetical protein
VPGTNRPSAKIRNALVLYHRLLDVDGVELRVVAPAVWAPLGMRTGARPERRVRPPTVRVGARLAY